MEDMAKNKPMDSCCMELAKEGERLYEARDWQTAVLVFEAAVKAGTNDWGILSTIYNQLGMAYYCLEEYDKALDYHTLDLELSKNQGDMIGEATASGNLGHTLKMRGAYDDAIACFQRHKEINRHLSDMTGEAMALYNLGTAYQAKGEHRGIWNDQDFREFPEDARGALQKAANYYEESFTLAKTLGDKAAQGRACGNLGKTHHLLGNFKLAIKCHEERLSIAKELGDKRAERRAYSNLGNAHIFLKEFEVACDEYRESLEIAKQLGDKVLEGEACYYLGKAYEALGHHDEALVYTNKHLQIFREVLVKGTDTTRTHPVIRDCYEHLKIVNEQK